MLKHCVLSFSHITIQYPFIFSLAVGLFIAGNTAAQSEIDTRKIAAENRKYLMEHLSFYYVENPNSEGSEAYKLDNAAIAEGKNEGAFWIISNRLLPKLVEELLCADEDAKGNFYKGNFFLQYDAAEVLKILNKPVQVWIYNDTKPLGAYAREKYAPCTDSLGYVLPCATTFRKNNVQSDLWAGFIHLGVTHAVTNFNIQDKESNLFDSLQSLRSTFMHMLVHTQDHSDIDTHEYHTCETQRWFRIGEKPQVFVRAIPDRMLIYQEGIANAFGLSFHHYEHGPALKWFEKNGYLLVETFPDSADRDFMDKNWLYDQIREVAGEGDSIPNMPGYRGYKIRDLPPKFILHNEITIALILSSIGDVKLREALVKTHAEMADPNTSLNPLATLFKYLCEGELPAGETVVTAFKLPADAPKPYLLPLALADYFTAFRAQDKAAFGEIFGNELPLPWIDMYWDTMMEKVRKAIPDPMQEEDPEAEKSRYELITDVYNINFKHFSAFRKVLHLPM